MNDSRLSGIDPAKLQMLFSMSGQGASKSQNELMPFLMAVATRSRQNGMTFTPEETNLIIEVMKQGKSKEEIARIEKIRMMMRLIKEQKHKKASRRISPKWKLLFYFPAVSFSRIQLRSKVRALTVESSRIF